MWRPQLPGEWCRCCSGHCLACVVRDALSVYVVCLLWCSCGWGDGQPADAVQARIARLQRQQEDLTRVCIQCGGGGGLPGQEVDMEDGHIVCQSLECGVYFERTKTKHEMKNMKVLSEVAFQLLNNA